MTTPSECTLTQLALDLQRRNKDFQDNLTDAARQTASDPAAALPRFNQALIDADCLEQDELAFLTLQIQQMKTSWNVNRLQILIGKAQALLILGRYDESKAAIDGARSRIADPNQPASAILDELEVAIIQASE